MAKVKVDKKVRNFKLDCFVVDGEEVKDVKKAKEFVDLGEEVFAYGDVILYQGGDKLRVKTSDIEHIRIRKGCYELLTSSHIYIMI